MPRELYIGLMSGTSVDGIDAALIDFSDHTPIVVDTHSHAIPSDLKKSILDLCEPGENAINRLGVVDRQLGMLFAQSVNALLKKSAINSKEVMAIGSHGQTIRHQPEFEHAFTLQIGDANLIAAHTGITCIADFRRADMAQGGQGAPLAPGFHHYLLADANNSYVLNIGGMANLTYLPAADKKSNILGFDTGPGNTLLDYWAQQHLHKNYDQNGDWARSGHVISELLSRMLNDPYFAKKPPKSTGREYFNRQWLTTHLMTTSNPAPEDVQATLTELTAQSIAQTINSLDAQAKNLWICGGGFHNGYLIDQLQKHCPQQHIRSTEDAGIHPDWIEAAAFAWLAKQTLHQLPGNVPSVTGACQNAILGAIYRNFN